MSDNVISFPGAGSQEAPAPLDGSALKAQTIATTLDWLDKIRSQVERGNLENFMILAHAPKSDHFLTDIMPASHGMSPNLAARFMGVLELLKLEVSEVASMMPLLNVDGVVIKPHEDEDE